MTKQQTIESLERQMPSFYSLQQVIDIVKAIDDKPKDKANWAIEDLSAVIDDVIENYDTSDLVDYENIDISIDYDRRIEINNVNVDLECLRRDVVNAVIEFFDKKR